MLVVTASPARTALKISQLTDGGMPPTYDSMHWFEIALEHRTFLSRNVLFRPLLRQGERQYCSH
jgi:hypothetical protein